MSALPPDRSVPFAQSPLEDSGWDESVLGVAAAVYLGDVSKPPKRPSSFGALTPLQQVMLINRLGAGPSFTASHLSDGISIMSAAVDTHHPQLGLRLPEAGNAYAWAHLDSVPLRGIDSSFDLFVSRMLLMAGATGFASDDRRFQFNALLFHPLQNARLHGLPTTSFPEAFFGGVSLRLLPTLDPHAPSVAEYCLAHRIDPSATRFLEAVIHDNGLGIAYHYYQAKAAADAPRLESLAIIREWTNLNLAIELHNSGRPRSGPDAYVSRRFGVGLFDLMERVRSLNAYLEIRTRRLRAYRWFRPDEKETARFQLQPGAGPAECLQLPGTVFRILVPLLPVDR